MNGNEIDKHMAVDGAYEDHATHGKTEDCK